VFWSCERSYQGVANEKEDNDEYEAQERCFISYACSVMVFLKWDLVQAFNAIHAAGNFSYSNAVFFIL
jgi:hypothetical protein